MKIRYLIAALISFVAINAVALSPYTLQFSEFTELKVADGINVIYNFDASKAGKVEFDATPELASAVVFEPSSKKLTVKLARRDTLYVGLPTIKVYSTFLTKVVNEGDSLVKIESLQPVPELSLRQINNGRIVVQGVKTNELDASLLAGHGTIVVRGETLKASLSITGTGRIQADELKAETVSASVTGTGSIGCYAVTELSVKGLGSGSVRYRGAPHIKKSVFSTVKVEAVDPIN